MIYVLDTNVISDLIAGQEVVSQNFSQMLLDAHTIGLCQPVLYEVRRGLFWRSNTCKYTVFAEKISPRLTDISITNSDWIEAAKLWADAISRGRQLSDVDLLLAAVTLRLEARLVTSDDDFKTLPIQRVNWREMQPS